MTHNLAPERVLSTLNADGTRRYIRPKLAHGRFLARRRVVGFALIALFVFLPRIRIGDMDPRGLPTIGNQTADEASRHIAAADKGECGFGHGQ